MTPPPPLVSRPEGVGALFRSSAEDANDVAGSLSGGAASTSGRHGGSDFEKGK